MPEEILILCVISVICGTSLILGLAIMKSVANYHRAKLDAQRGGSEPQGLTASELRRLVREAIDEGTRPLARKLDELQAEVQELDGRLAALPEAPPRALLEMPEGPEEEATIPTGPRRTRA